MEISKIEYKVKTASELEIKTHLAACNSNFIPPLSERVNINEYSKKIAEKAITFEAWSGNDLVGLLAAYFNDTVTQTAFITNVSLLKDYMGAGIAAELLKKCIKYAKENKTKSIELEVAKDNEHAVAFYKKFNFVICASRELIFKMKLEMEG
jgi:ribosomal protein S18 acetylase RimI-like enzyme